MALSPFDFDDKAGNAIMGGQTASAGMGVATPGLRVSGGMPSMQQTDAAVGASAQNLLNSVQAPQRQAPMPVVGFNPQTREVFAGGRTFQIDDVATTSTALQKGFFDQGVDAIPEGFGKMSLQEVRQYITTRASDTSGTTVGDLGRDLKRGVMQLPGAATGVVDAVTGALGMGTPVGQGWDMLGERTGFQPGKWANEMTPQYSAGRQVQGMQINDAWKNGDAGDIAGAYLRNPGYVAGQAVQSLPGMVVGGVAGRAVAGMAGLSGVAGAGIGEGAMMAGQSMDQMMQNGADPQRAGVAALGIGATGGVVGAGSGAIARRMGMPDIDVMIAGGGRETTRPLVQRVPMGAFQEGVLEELPQSLLEQGGQNWAENKPITQGMARAGVEGTLAGSLMGGAFQMAARRGAEIDLNKYVGDKQQEQQQQQQQQQQPRIDTLQQGQNLDLFGAPSATRTDSPLPEFNDPFAPPPAPPAGPLAQQFPDIPAARDQSGSADLFFPNGEPTYGADRDYTTQNEPGAMRQGTGINNGTLLFQQPGELNPTDWQQPTQQGLFDLSDWLPATNPVDRQIQSQRAFDALQQKAGSGQLLTPYEHAVLRTGAPAAPTLQDGPGIYTEGQQQRGFELSGNPTPQFDNSKVERPDFELEMQDGRQGELDLTGGQGTGPVQFKVAPNGGKAKRTPKQGEMQLHPEGVTGTKAQGLYDRAARVMTGDDLDNVVSQLQARAYKAAEKDIVKAERAKAAPATAPAPAAAPQTVSEKIKQRVKAKKAAAAPAQPPAAQTVAQQLGVTNAQPDQKHADAVNTEAAATAPQQERDAQADGKKPRAKGTGQKAAKAKEKVSAPEPQPVVEEAPAAPAEKAPAKRSAEVDDAEEAIADEKEYADLPEILEEVDRLSNAADMDMLEKKDRAVLKNRLNYLQSLVDDTTVPEHIRMMAQEAITAAPTDLVNEVKRQQKNAESNREHRSEQRARDKAALGGIIQKLYLSPQGRKITKVIKDWMESHDVTERFDTFVRDLMADRWNGKPIAMTLMPAVEYLEERIQDARTPENAQYGVDKGWRDIHDLLTGAKTLGEALKRLQSSPYTKGWQRMLIRALLSSASVRSSKLVLNAEYVDSETTADAYKLGQYDYNDNTTYLHGGGGLQSLLHEAVHAAVFNKMEADDAFRKAISDLFLKAQKHISGDKYGMTDIQEFVAEAFSNPDFQAELAKIPSTGVKSAGSLWDSFVDLIRSALRLFGVQRSLLDDVISVTAPHIEDNTPPTGTDGPNGRKAPERAIPKFASRVQQEAGLLKGAKALENKLNWMTLRQLKDEFAGQLDGLKEFITVVFTQASATNKRINELTPLAEKLDAYARSGVKFMDRVRGKRSEAADALFDVLIEGDRLEVDLRDVEDAKKRWDASKDAEVDKAADVHALLEKYEALPEDAKKLYAETRDFYKKQAEETNAAMVNMVTSLIRDPAIRRARLADLAKWYATRAKGYFPHVRFGDFILSYNKDGQRYVEFFETEREAQAARAELKATGIDSSLRRKSDVNSSGFDLITDLTSAVDKLDIDREDGAIKQQMRDILQEVYMKNLPEFSGAKFRLRREGTQGYSKDVVRAMATQGSRMARHISRMEHMPLRNAALNAMNDARTGRAFTYVATYTVGGTYVTRKGQGTQLEGGTKHTKVFSNRLELQEWLNTEGTKRRAKEEGGQMVNQELAFTKVESTEDADKFLAGKGIPEADRPMTTIEANLKRTDSATGDFTKADTLYNHIRKVNAMDTAEPSGWMNAITQAAWVYHLGLTPSFAVINLMQVPSMHTPWLASRRGIGLGRAYKHTTAAYGLVIKNMANLAKATWKEDVLSSLQGVLGKDSAQFKALRWALDRNLIDFTTSYDLMAMADSGAGVVGDAKRKLLKMSAYMAQYSEVTNRLVVALSTYNAAVEIGMSDAEAKALMEKGLVETQGDYSPENTAYAMDRRRNTPLTLMFQFQKYRQFVLYGLIDNMKKTFKGDKEARDYLLGLLVSNGALFGTVGMPAALPILYALLALGGDDDEPVDIALSLKRFYTDLTGSEKMAEVMVHGAVRMLGVSVTGRAGMGDIIPGTRALMDPKQSSEKDAANAWAVFFTDTFAGAAGGIFNNMFLGAGYMMDGQFGRGVEAMSPKAVKDAMASVRYYNDGIATKDGTSRLMDQVSLDTALIKALGFTPAEVANLYERRGSLQAIEQFVNNGKTKVKHAFVRAVLYGDSDDVDAAVAKWQAWNEAHPGKASQIPYSDLLKARSGALKKEKELLQSSGLYSTKQGRQIAQEYGLE